jgi:hypothetical protein
MVEQILAKKPGITFNIQELVCSVLKDDSFINKLVPKICESVCQKLEEKYVNLVNDDFNKVCTRKVDSSTPKPYLVSLKTDSF